MKKKITIMFSVLSIMLTMIKFNVNAEETSLVEVNKVVLLDDNLLEYSEDNLATPGDSFLVEIDITVNGLEGSTALQLPSDVEFNPQNDVVLEEGISYSVETGELKFSVIDAPEKDALEEARTISLNTKIKLSAKFKDTTNQSELFNFWGNSINVKFNQPEIEEPQNNINDGISLSSELVGGEVSILDSQISYRVNSGQNWIIIKDGSSIVVGSEVKFDVKWEITNTSLITPGDTFTIDLPVTYFSFVDTSKKPINVVAQSGTISIGTFEIKGGKAVIVINDEIKQFNSIKDGWFEFTGRAEKNKNESENTHVGGITLPNFEIKPGTPGGNGLDAARPLPSRNPIFKYGIQLLNQDKIQWRLTFNLDEYKRISNLGTDVEVRKNAMVVDRLTPEQKFDRLEINSIFYWVKADKTITEKPIKTFRLANSNNPALTEFTRVDSIFGESFDDYYARMEKLPKSYGIHTDTSGTYSVDSIVFNFGTMPDENAHLDVYDQLISAVNASVTATQAEKNATMASLNHLKNETNNGMFLSYNIIIHSDLEDDLPSGNIRNMVEYKYDVENGGSDSIESVASIVYQAMNGGALGIPKGTVQITKVDGDTAETLTGVTIGLYKKTGGSFVPYDSKVTDGSGVVKFENLELGTYKIYEISPLNGYLSEFYFEGGASGEFTISGSEVVGFAYVMFNYKEDTLNLQGVKKELGDGSIINGNYTFEILNDDNIVVAYGKVALTNSNADTPIEFYRDAALTSKIEDNTWHEVLIDGHTYEIKETNPGKNTVKYYVNGTESNIFEANHGGSTIEIGVVNSPLIDFEVEKIWDDNNNQDGKRPESITVTLIENNTKVDSVVITPDANGDWKASFTDLPVYEDGNLIVYTVIEEAVTDYQSDLTGNPTDGFVITNSYTPGKTTINIEKVWDDNNNQDKKRPGSITVNLIADGVKINSVSVKPDTKGDWKVSFSNLPLFKDGKEIVYTIEEELVDGYKGIISGNLVDGIVITNTVIPDKPHLPSTGIESNNLHELLGLVSVLVGGFFLILKKKKELNK